MVSSVFSKKQSKIIIPGPVGGLEAVLNAGEGEGLPHVAIVCHPHSLHGGSLSNKVVTTVARTFNQLGIATVRFNFRGVGESEGNYDQGIGETDDLLAVIDWVVAHSSKVSLSLAGFSFGSFVAARAAGRRQVKQLISIAPPVGKLIMDSDTAYDFVGLTRPSCPWLVIQGTEDEVVTAQTVFDWAANMDEPPDVISIEGASHFFHGRLVELKTKLQDWVIV